jgi:DNA-binding protein HU-beta
MTKSQWIEKAAKQSGISKKDLGAAYDALYVAFEDTLISGESVQITGFGTFAVREKAAYTARNPKTGEPVEIPASRRVVFLPGKTLKDKINEA